MYFVSRILVSSISNQEDKIITMSQSNQNSGTSPTTKLNLHNLTTTPMSAYSAENMTSSPENWHNEASSALFDGPASTDPSVHHPHPNQKPLRRASCPYDGTCTHEIETNDKACSCGKVTKEGVQPHHNHHHHHHRPIHREHVQHDRNHPEQREHRVDSLSITRRDSYDDYKRGWYQGWLGDGSEEQAQPWGFSSTHASRGASPVPESKFESLH